MAPRKRSPEVAAKLAAVQAEMGNLEDRHLNWILGAAFEHFAKAVEKTEAEILRYERFPERPLYTRYGKAGGYGDEEAGRDKEVAKLRVSLDEYFAILGFLQALKDAEVIMSAESFAAEMRASGFGIGARR